MIMFKCLWSQIFFFFIFVILFITGSILLENYIHRLDREKTKFPILIYSENIDELENIVSLSAGNIAFDSYQIVRPNELKNSLIERYELEDIEEITKDFALPNQLIISVKPVEIELLMLLVLEIGENSPQNIIQYNEQVWREVDKNVERLKKLTIFIQIAVLCMYIFVQTYLRMTSILKQKQLINAIINAGFPSMGIVKINVTNNIMFLLITLLLSGGVNFLINYFGLISYIITDLSQNYWYLNIEILFLLLLANIFLLIFQKPMLKRNHNV
ncbi:MAG: hypothetical protein FWG20_01775 [Candidatus Cloacimonetes bacterium]|nr:hypothetical protein [Candidatus Cloacimonadota bacterium]